MIIFGILLLVANFLLGLVLIQRSTSTVRELIRKNMLNISNTAAGLIEGDELGALTEENVGSDVYNKILEELSVFQNNVDIEYIYAVRQVSEEDFEFTVDADPEDPADFGEEVLVTDALRKAAQGTAAVDDAPAQDEWVNFYSSYSPVFDSGGRVAGIIGVDFDSEWYEAQIRSNTVLVLVISALFVLVGLLVFVMISRRFQARFSVLNNEISNLSGDVDALTKELLSDQGYIASLSEVEQEDPGALEDTDRDQDEIAQLSRKIRSMHSEMKRYLDYAQRRAVTDALTNVSNTTAYTGLQERLESEITEGVADFAIAMFDINDLKKTNDRFGHFYGDRIIRNAAQAISTVFGTRNTFRIGGDELLAVSFRKTVTDMQEMLKQVDEAVEALNQEEAGTGLVLSISSGTSVYEPGNDTCFRDVFMRADEAMYSAKQRYHENNN